MSANSVCELQVTIEHPSNAREVWDRYVESHPDASCFHLTAWQRAIEETFRYRCYNLMATRGEEVCGVLPLYRTPHLPFGKSLISTPMAVYGGICADDESIATALLERAKALADSLGVKYLELRNERALEGLPTKDLYYTFKREIFEDEDANMAAIPRNQRRSIRIAKKNELEARLGGEELLDGFFHLYSMSVRNHGSPVYPKAFFARLLSEYGERCRIQGIFKDGELLCAVLTFFFRDQVLPYYAGADKKAFKLAVYDYVYWSLMCHGSEQGYKVFDFGRSKKETGSFNFKRHWGFEPTPLAYQYHLVTQQEIPDLSPANPKMSLPIRVWQKLPLGLTQWLGPKVIKYFP